MTTSKSSKTSKTTTTASNPVPPISAAVVAQCTALLAQISALLGPIEPLSADDIRRSLKLRKGGAEVITDVFNLCTQHGITAVGPVTVQEMNDQFARATALNQIGVQLSAVHKAVDDAAFSAESASWQSATALYTTLQRLAAVDPTLAAGLQPVQAFFQTRKTKGTARATKVLAKAQAANKRAAKYTSPKSPPPAPAAPAAGETTAPAAASPATPPATR
jgi:hypothetical protein